MSKKKTMPAEEKFTRARSLLAIDAPFFSALMCAGELREEEANVCPTMATDGLNILWSRDFVDRMTVDELVFVLAHEVLHIAMDHVSRLNDRNHRKWNVATDYIINHLLKTEGLGSMPEGGLLDADLFHKSDGSADKLYGLLPDDPVRLSDPLDELMPPPKDPAEAAAQRGKVKVAVASAAQAARMCGKLPASIKRLVEEILEPVVDWRRELRDFVASKSNDERSYARPSRRHAWSDVILPGSDGERIGPIVVAVDCSGSIAPKELAEFAAEIKAIHTDFKPETLTVMYFDTVVSHVDTFDPDDECTIEAHGGGGTAFSPIFSTISKLALEPVGIIVLTDLYCNDFGPPPEAPVLWVCNTNQTEVPWGRVVPMKSART